jgi:hypothetical protein
MPLLRKLESLLGHPLPHLSEHTFRLAWEREQVRRTHSLSSSSPSAPTAAAAAAATSASPHAYAPSSASPSGSAASSAGGMPPAKQPRLGPGPADDGGAASSPLPGEDPAHVRDPSLSSWSVHALPHVGPSPPRGMCGGGRLTLTVSRVSSSSSC